MIHRNVSKRLKHDVSRWFPMAHLRHAKGYHFHIMPRAKTHVPSKRNIYSSGFDSLDFRGRDFAFVSALAFAFTFAFAFGTDEGASEDELLMGLSVAGKHSRPRNAFCLVSTICGCLSQGTSPGQGESSSPHPAWCIAQTTTESHLAST